MSIKQPQGKYTLRLLCFLLKLYIKYGIIQKNVKNKYINGKHKKAKIISNSPLHMKSIIFEE